MHQLFHIYIIVYIIYYNCVYYLLYIYIYYLLYIYIYLYVFIEYMFFYFENIGSGIGPLLINPTQCMEFLEFGPCRESKKSNIFKKNHVRNISWRSIQ